MIETGGNLRLRKTVGSGMIRLVWVSSPLVELLPQITFEDFDRCQEPEDGHVSPCEIVPSIALSFFGEGRKR
jgi:hypothetical protein